MKLIVDFEYGEEVTIKAFKDGKVFMKSPMKVKIPKKPYPCSEKQFAKWEVKVYNKLLEEVGRSFKEEIYGKVSFKVNGLSYSGEVKDGK